MHASSGGERGAGIGEYVLLTGATGFLGGQILRRLVERHPRTRLAIVVRSRRGQTAAERGRRLLIEVLGEAAAVAARARVDVVEGDVSEPGLSMPAHELDRLAERVDHVIHCAAAIRFDLPLADARRHNRDGTRNVLAFAERARTLRRLDYVGTAYVAGRRTGRILEDELDLGQGFWNSYEQTKLEAEALVRDHALRRRTAIHRPSIIVGDSGSGRTTASHGLYQVLPLYLRRLVLAIPADPEARLDFVPIDYVIEALFALMGTEESLGRTFHLASGPGKTCTMGEILGLIAESSGVRSPPVISLAAYRRFVRPVFQVVLWGKMRAAMRKGEHYLPYLSSRLAFDKTNTEAILRPLGIEVPHCATYFRRLVSFQARGVVPSAEAAGAGASAGPVPSAAAATDAPTVQAVRTARSIP